MQHNRLNAGIRFAAAAAVLFWFILRRGAILSPQETGATTGLLSGLVGVSVLEMHCQNLNAWHISLFTSWRCGAFFAGWPSYWIAR
ncbi:MAG: NrsF family protein [Bryobacteraceae bacterium]